MLHNKLAIGAGVLILAMLSNTAIAKSNFYVFGTFGNTNSDISFNAQNRIDGDTDSYALGAGYTVNRNFSIEAAYQRFGSQDATTDCPPGFACAGLVIPLFTKADLTAYSLSVIGSIPVTDRIDVYGEVGIASWDVDFNGISSAFDTSGEDLLYGAGVRWSIDDHWKVSGEYGKVDLGFDTAGISVSYHF
jgi:opacity protein-like surface antigen